MALGFALGFLPLIEPEIASGYLVSPLRVPAWDGPDYVLVVSRDRERDPAVTTIFVAQNNCIFQFSAVALSLYTVRYSEKATHAYATDMSVSR